MNSSLMQKLVKSYYDRTYSHATTISHKGSVVAFAMDDKRQIFYAVMDLSSHDDNSSQLDVDAWPQNPSQLHFPSEIEQVGFSVAGVTPIPVVKKGSRSETDLATIRKQEVDPFLSTTARFSAYVPFRVFSDNRRIFIFRQAIASGHEDAVYKLEGGGASGDSSHTEFLKVDNEKVPIVDSTLLCDCFVLSRNMLLPCREVRYRRSRNKVRPSGTADSLGANDMDGNPFFVPTQELAMMSNLQNGCFDVLQLPTAIKAIKRWQIFAYNSKTQVIDSLNMEVNDDGLFNLMGTQLYTSPDLNYRASVLQSKPGKCPFTKLDLVPLKSESRHAESCVGFSQNGDYLVASDMQEITYTSFTVEMCVKGASENHENGVGVFATELCYEAASANTFQIVIENNKYKFVHSEVTSEPFGTVLTEWQHIAATYNGSEMKLYFNGKLQSVVSTGSLQGRFKNIVIGSDRSGTKSFNGMIDEVRMWDYGRSESDINSKKVRRLAGEEAGLQSYWRLDEGSGKTAYDQTSNARHATLHGKSSWKASDCPIGDNKAKRRSSFSVSGVTVGSGISASLYFQQEVARSGYDQSEKPMKKQTRVFIAVCTVRDKGDQGPIAAIDVAVSREGRMAQIPDVLTLPPMTKPEPSTNVDMAVELEKQYRTLSSEILELQTGIETLKTQILKIDDLKRQVVSKENEVKTALQVYRNATHDYKNYYCYLKFRSSNKYLSIIQGNFFGETDSRRDKFAFIPSNWIDGRYKILRKDGGYLAWNGTLHEDNYSPGEFELRDAANVISGYRPKTNAPIIAIGYVDPSEYQHPYLLRNTREWFLRAPKFSMATFEYYGRYGAESACAIEIEKGDIFNQQVTDKKIEWESSTTELQKLQAQLMSIEAVGGQISQAEQNISTMNAKKEDILVRIGELTSGMQAPLVIPMTQLHTDTAGLTMSGGLLEFARARGTPHVMDSATGQVCIYFRSPENSLMAAYFDVNVRRARFNIDDPSSLTFVGRGAGANLNEATLTITDGSSPKKANLSVVKPSSGLKETWKNLPRDPLLLTAIMNGEKNDKDVTVEIEPDNLSVKNGSSQLIAVVNKNKNASMVANGVMTATPGQYAKWIADAPGRTYYFEQSTTPLTLPGEPTNASIPQDMFTVEAWVKPASALNAVGRVLHHFSNKSGYSLALKYAGMDNAKKTYKVIADMSLGSDGDTEIHLRSDETIPADEWNHLAMTFRQSYSLYFNGTQHVSCGSNDMLNITGNLTVEMFVQLDDLNKPHGLMGKGSLGDKDKNVPYQLRLNTSGQIELIFENESGKRTITSTSSLSAGNFHKIAVTRRAGQNKKTGQPSTETFDYSVDGQQKQLTLETIKSVEFEDFFDIEFFIDGVKSGSARYTGKAPSGHSGTLEIGRCFEAASNIMYTRGNIAEVRIWSDAVSDGNIGRKLNGSENGLTAWWPFEERKGNIATDKKGSNNGTLHGPKWKKSPDPDASIFKVYNNGLMMTMNSLSKEASELSGGWGKKGTHLGGTITESTPFGLYRGLVEEVRLWATVRTEEQILDNLFTRLKGEKEDLILYYTFDRESTQEDANTLRDDGLRGNHLHFPAVQSERPKSMLSDAPISTDSALIRSALFGVATTFQDTGDSAASAVEYADMQRDYSGKLGGVMKRCYSYIKDGSWTLHSGYKVGNLKTEWIGQAQFEPQVMGYIEGAPPVPSENLTDGVVYSAEDASSIELVESESVSYTLSTSKEGSSDAAFSSGLQTDLGSDDLMILAPLGIGYAKKMIEAEFDAGVKGNFQVSDAWSQEESLGESSNRSKNISVASNGSLEDDDTQRNPVVGRRALPQNTGYALIQSATADVYALRLEHNNALVSYRMLPNPDIPLDWNILPFKINPQYTKQGTLDGKIGFDATGAVVTDEDYPMATTDGEYSYFKPKEAYEIERNIRRDEQRRKAYYEDYKTGYGDTMLKVVGAAAGAAASLLIPGIGLAASTTSTAVALSTMAKTFNETSLIHSFSKRDLCNTYVWSADGGFFAETTETSQIRTDESSGNFGFAGSVSGNFKTGVEIFSFGFSLEFDASLGGGMSISRKRSKESEKTFSMDVDVNVPRDLKKYEKNNAGVYVLKFEDNHTVTVPGKVDAYRFKTFYIDSRTENFDYLYGKVIDPLWLQSPSNPNAAALRKARQSDKKPPCWRVFHRVTFVSRILPAVPDPTAAPLESAIKAQGLGSNWELIEKLDPFVRGKTYDISIFSDAVRSALMEYLPELSSESDSKEIIKYLQVFYNVPE